MIYLLQILSFHKNDGHKAVFLEKFGQTKVSTNRLMLNERGCKNHDKLPMPRQPLIEHSSSNTSSRAGEGEGLASAKAEWYTYY